jgi:hypothetical protein
MKVAALVVAVGCLAQSVGALRRKRHGTNLTSTGVWVPERVGGKLSIDRPAFLTYDAKKKEILVSQFGVKSKYVPLPATSTISRISANDISKSLRSGNMKNVRVTKYVEQGVLWPNKLSFFNDLLVIPDGFLPPGKSDGNVFLTKDGSSLARITPKKKGAFYHVVEWHDFDGDGNKDLLTARTITEGFIPKFRGELVWYRNPGRNKMLSQEWEEHIIVDGPDVDFKTIKHGSGLAVICTQFFSERLTVHFVNAKGEYISSRIIDDKLGKAFGVEVVDLDGDGKDELLVTNHEAKQKTSAVFAYQLPNDLRTGKFTKHVLAINIFKTENTIFPGAGSPGFAHAFHPRVGASARQPKHIVVAGDGSKDVWYLRPKSGQRFGYESIRVGYWGGTTGELLVRDIDGDGIMDVLVPDNDNFNIQAFTFSEK